MGRKNRIIQWQAEGIFAATLAAAILCMGAAPAPAATRAPASAPATTAKVQPAPLLIYGHPVEIVDGFIQFAGTMKDRTASKVSWAAGMLYLGAKTLRWPDAKHPLYRFHQLKMSAKLLFARPKTGLPHTRLTQGNFSIASIRWQKQTFRHAVGQFNYRGQILSITTFHALYHKVPCVMTAHYNHFTGNLRAHLKILRINQKEIFKFFAPTHVNVIGPASLTANIQISGAGVLSGNITLNSVGPGLLEVKNVPLLTRRAVSVYGRRMATLIVEDLRKYPYAAEHLTATESGGTLVIKYHFTRTNTNPQKLKAHMVTIGGTKMLFTPQDLKSYSSTITLPHIGLRRLLKLSGEFTHPDKH